MAEEIDVPGIGQTKATYVYVAVALVLGIVGYAWYSHNKAAAASADTGGYVPGLDPNSGGTTTPGLSTPSVPTPDTSTDPDLLPPRTNIEWSQRVTKILTEKFGFDGQMVATVIGKYLSRQGLAPSEQDLIRTAWGQLGRPPEGDFPILPVPASPTTPTPTPTPPPPGGTEPKYARVLKGWHVDRWILDYRALSDGVPDLTWERLEALNPGIAGNVAWHKDHTLNTFKAGATYRTR